MRGLPTILVCVAAFACAHEPPRTAHVDDLRPLRSIVRAERVKFGTSYYTVADVGNGIEASMTVGVDGSVLVAADGVNFLYETTDAGLTWTSVAPPSAPGLLNEGDLATGPDGTTHSAWLDPSRPNAARVFVRPPGGRFVERPIVGPQPVPDRPWVVAARGTGPQAAPIGVVSANSLLVQDWGSSDGGLTWIENTVARSGLTLRTPDLSPDPFLDLAGPSFSARMWWTPLPGAGLLDRRFMYWTADFKTWYQAAGPIRQVGGRDNVRIASTGTVYDVRFEAGGREIRYRYLKDGTWSAFRTVATFAQAGRYDTNILSNGTVPLMALDTHGSMLGINTRDGDQDVLLRVHGADTAGLSVTRANIGPGCTERYDYPTLIFDRDGRAITSFCSGRVAYEQP